MGLAKIDIVSVRNIRQANITPSPGLNFIYGGNASGKSAFLEAIFVLGRTRSFRTSTINTVPTFGEMFLRVAGQINHADGSSTSLGLQLGHKSYDLRINHQDVTNKSELAYLFPVQLFHPKTSDLIDAGSQLRREFLDWGLFNGHKRFLHIWRQYKKILSYRNVLLKSHALAQLNAWSNELVAYGEQVAQLREHYINRLRPIFLAISHQVLEIGAIELLLVPGWDEAIPLTKALENDFNRDIRNGYTHSGPHRCDFQVLIEGRLAKHIVSRGQQKMLAICLLLAQAQLLVNEGGVHPCILIDDFAAELDMRHRKKILSYLAAIQCQVFMTAIEAVDFGILNEINHFKMFHVEHGNVKPM